MSVDSGPRQFPAQDFVLRDARRLTLREIRADDAGRMQGAIRAMSAESRYTRFMSALRELSPRMLERAVNPDATSELQLIAVHGEGSEQEIVAGARYAAAPGSRVCEFAVTVTDPWQGCGLARRLLEALIAEARTRGFTHMEGYILPSNDAMLALAKKLGFTAADYPEDPGVRLVRRALS